MLNPAAVVKIVSFKDTLGRRFPEANETTNIMEVQLDSGNVIDVLITSNDKDYNNKLAEFLNFKTMSIIKSSEIKKASLDIMLNLDRIDNVKLQNRINFLMNEGIPNGQMGPKKLSAKDAKNEAVKELATEMVIEKRKIKASSIVRMPIGVGRNNNYTSRFIMVKKGASGMNEYATNGLYSFAQTSNHIPLEIKALKKRDGSFTGFFKVLTAKTINASQIKFLINHSIRTVTQMVSDNKKPFLLKIMRQNDPKLVFPDQYSNLARQLNAFEEKNRVLKDGALLSGEEYAHYVCLMESFLNLMEDNKSWYKFFKASVPIVVDSKYMEKAILNRESSSSSPLQNLPNSMVMLNYNTSNPNIKEGIKGVVFNKIKDFYSGANNMTIFTVIHFIAPDIFDEIDTWGFPINNIDLMKMNLSYNDTLSLESDIKNYEASNGQ